MTGRARAVPRYGHTHSMVLGGGQSLWVEEGEVT